MELRHLRYFVAVAEEQNVTRAAARLNVSQPPLSRQIRDLEDELGFALFEHRAKSVKLTEAGHFFLNKVRHILKETEDAVRAAKSVANGESGEIHIGYAPSLSSDILPRALRLFHQENSGVRVELHDLSTQEMVRGLRNGELQLAYMAQTSKRAISEFKFRELRRFEICVAVEPNHRLAKARKVSLEEVAKEPIIAFTLTNYPEHRVWLTELFAPLKKVPRICEEHDSVTSLIASVEAGRGVAMVLEPFKRFAPRVKIRHLTPPPPPVPFGLACAKGPHSELISRFFSAAERS
jgi:LysR family transcriptional regulator, benzoate and cis,cis-muconate-responsive activator of ben and cat genes